MEEVLANARLIFSTVPPCNVESDLEFINNLLREPTTLAEPSHNLAQNDLEHRTAQDEAEAKEDLARSENTNLKEISEIDFALRSLEMMGQVLKNFPTDLRKDLKFSLTRESYSLALRITGSLLQNLQHSREKFRQVMLNHLSKESVFAGKTSDKKDEYIDNVVILFAQLGIFGVLKKVSDALGTEELRHTYDQVRSELGETQIATRLIDLSIRLDHFGMLPEADILDLEKRLRGNRTAWTVLGMLVHQHMSLFPTHWKTRQKLVGLFKFARTTGLPSPKQLLSSGN